MDEFQNQLIDKLYEVVEQDDITQLSIDFSLRVPELLRLWARQIEAGEIIVKSAVVTLDTENSVAEQSISIVTTTTIEQTSDDTQTL
jgi:hypothetical protein